MASDLHGCHFFFIQGETVGIYNHNKFPSNDELDSKAPVIRYHNSSLGDGEPPDVSPHCFLFMNDALICRSREVVMALKAKDHGYDMGAMMGVVIRRIGNGLGATDEELEGLAERIKTYGGGFAYSKPWSLSNTLPKFLRPFQSRRFRYEIKIPAGSKGGREVQPATEKLKTNKPPTIVIQSLRHFAHLAFSCATARK